MIRRSRFQLNSLMLIALLAGLAFTLLGSPAQAGCGKGLFGGLFKRKAACAQTAAYSHQSYSTYAAAPAPCGPCGQQTATYSHQTYATYAAAPCAPCGATAPAYSAPAPVYYPSTAPPVYSAPPTAPPAPVPQVGGRYDCSNGSCRLIR